MAAPKWGSLAFFVLLITISTFQSLSFAREVTTSTTTTNKDHRQQEDQVIKPTGSDMEGGTGGTWLWPWSSGVEPSPEFSIGGRIDFGDDENDHGSSGCDDGFNNIGNGGGGGISWGGVPLFCTPLPPAECHDGENCGVGRKLYLDFSKSRPTITTSYKSNVDERHKNGAHMMANDKSSQTDKTTTTKRPTHDGKNVAGEGQQGHNGQENMMTRDAIPIAPGHN
ncbi:hypothetical protein TorRG33x02_079990 [Trema orientale]|uniref:Uncharacterized protein n=1 Tax=Trema orientale TaxID=63057 RepID=A0A2P5FE70_TREOI|nr:hypothetical protein TorRG33x02_079990 [Trema orientale]